MTTESQRQQHPPAPGAGVVAVHDELVRLMRQLLSSSRIPDGAPTLAQHSLLSFIADNPGCRATQISDAFEVHRSTVSRQLRGCVEIGWVHAEHGPLRSGYPLSLTPDGSVVLAQADARRVEDVRERIADWPDGAVEEFARSLRKFRCGAPTLRERNGGDAHA